MIVTWTWSWKSFCARSGDGPPLPMDIRIICSAVTVSTIFPISAEEGALHRERWASAFVCILDIAHYYWYRYSLFWVIGVLCTVGPWHPVFVLVTGKWSSTLSSLRQLVARSNIIQARSQGEHKELKTYWEPKSVETNISQGTPQTGLILYIWNR